jgi:carboxyl-terminal processing protease
MHPLLAALHQQGLLFDYATEYAAQKPAPASPRAFSLPDPDYQNFVDWMKKRTYNYENALEKNLQTLKQATLSEDYLQELSSPLNQLQQMVAAKRKNELIIYRDFIRQELEEEIISRYFLEAGAIELSLQRDENIRKAVALLADNQAYRNTLRMR